MGILLMNKIKIAPSLLSADFSDLRGEVEKVEAAGADWLHVDVMDGHFVPNITMGPFIVEAIKKVATKPLDVHLMIDDPLKYAEPFVKAGADSITFHIESPVDHQAVIDRLRGLGVGVAITLNPPTPVTDLAPWLSQVDMVLVMSVNPGFSGQKFIESSLEKVRWLRQQMGEGKDIEIDGGINMETGPLAVGAGATILVAGTAIFRADDPARVIAALRKGR